MCGITGYVSVGTPVDAAVLSRMTDTLRYRGPDARDTWLNDDGTLGLGHTRLAIQDLSSAGAQPMRSCCGRYCLVFNGEIYNHRELRAALQAEPIHWRGHSDTEVLLNCLIYWGVETTLKACKGMFALAFYSVRSKSLTLARDRFGEKPLYYSTLPEGLVFGSELKALKAHPEFNTAICEDALALYLTHNYVPTPYSIYQGTFKLPPATFLTVNLNRLSEPNIEAYWNPVEAANQAKQKAKQQATTGTESQLVDTVDKALNQAVERQMVSDVPIGCLLSGGIDSSLIAAKMQQVANQPVRSFTLGFEEAEHDESRFAKTVADHLGTQHTEITATADDALSLIPALCDFYDEPFADSSQIPTTLVMRLVSEHVPVVLTGDAGDEAFAGYNRYTAIPKVWQHVSRFPPVARRFLGKSLTTLSAHTLDTLLTPLPGVEWGAKCHKLGQRLSHATSPQALYRAIVSEWDGCPPMYSQYQPDRYINILANQDQWPWGESQAEAMMLLDTQTYMPDDILTKVDRASMASSVEARAPFLDPDLFDAAWRLPITLKLKQGQQKYVLRQLLSRHLPLGLFERPKTGFCIPLDDWLRGPLQAWADDLLSQQKLDQHGLFNHEIIRAVWHDHQQRGQNYGYRLWSVLMFQAWYESQH